jgi:hypothetical protein
MRNVFVAMAMTAGDTAYYILPQSERKSCLPCYSVEVLRRPAGRPADRPQTHANVTAPPFSTFQFVVTSRKGTLFLASLRESGKNDEMFVAVAHCVLRSITSMDSNQDHSLPSSVLPPEDAQRRMLDNIADGVSEHEEEGGGGWRGVGWFQCR